MKIYVVTAFGPMIDTICEVFKDNDMAIKFINDNLDRFNITNIEHITETIWKTEDADHQNVEWQIHTREI